MKKDKMYSILCKQLEALIEDVSEPISIMANASALLYMSLSDINWAGCYLLKNNQLTLGPFQGEPACSSIPLGKGVCGVCAATKQIQCVGDVHAFPTHIACDSKSNAEIVLPIMVDDELYGVLDIDSPSYHRFDHEDEVGLQAFVTILANHIHLQ